VHPPKKSEPTAASEEKVVEAELRRVGSRKPRGIVETTRVEIMPFSAITEEMARAYGEGERTVEWWRRVVGAFYGASAARQERFSPTKRRSFGNGSSS
jgi:uncharacterized protein YhfF